jgi:phage terminase small subunit
VPTKSRKTTKGHKPARERGRSASPAQAKAQNAPTQESQDVELWIDEDLTAQQERFVNELCADPRRNGTRAAMLAYPNQNYQSARSEAKRQLQNPKVRAAIDRRLGALARLTRTSIEEVTRTIGDGMHWDIADVLDESGNFLPLREWPAEIRKQLVSIDAEEVVEGGKTKTRILKVKFSNRVEYVTLGAKMNRMLTDKMEHDIGETLEQVLTKMAAARS